MIILNEAKPKYEKLDQLLEKTLLNITLSNQVNIIIDLKEIFRKFFRPDIGIEGQQRKYLVEEISADIINTIAHYRNYFYKKGKYTTFYVLYSFNKCNAILKINEKYKKDYYEKYFNPNDPKVSIIKSVGKVVQNIVNTIPHAYFIETSKFDEFIYARYIKEKTKDNELLLILSNDTVFFQLIDENVKILNIKGIKSELIEKENAVSILTNKESTLSPKLIPLILSIAGYKKYSFPNISNIAIGRAVQITEKLLAEEKIVENDTIEFPIDFNNLSLKNSKTEELLISNKENIINNYKLIKNDNLYYSNLPLIKVDFVGHNKIGSSNYFLDLNSKIFTLYPLQIDMLLRGEKV